jgi:DNA repair protein RecO (recombination protein O)
MFYQILHHSIHEEEKNEPFFVLEVAGLSACDEIANFHLVLLLEVSKYLGSLILRISIFARDDEEFTPFSAEMSSHSSNELICSKAIRFKTR